MTVAQLSVNFVMVSPTHPGNIGAAARAIKVMGFRQLSLVNPCAHLSGEAIARAAGADDLLHNATCHARLTDATADDQLVFVCSARERRLSSPVCAPRDMPEIIKQHGVRQVAIVFGPEASGLSNEDCSLGHYQVMIPSDPTFSSLNLAAAIQILAYELSLLHDFAVASPTQDSVMAAKGAVDGLLSDVERLCLQVGFIGTRPSQQLFRRIQRVFYRAMLEVSEVHILRGLVKMLATQCRGSDR